jgi:hypothetical protein
MGLNNQQNQWTTQLKQTVPPCVWKGITMKKVTGMQIHLPAIVGGKGHERPGGGNGGEGPPGCSVGGAPLSGGGGGHPAR